MKDTIKIDREGYEELHAAYEKAVESGAAQFDWRGHLFVTGYAKYLLVYLAPQFEERKP